MSISESVAKGLRDRRVLRRVVRASWRLKQAEREREWALASARSEEVSIRKLAQAAGLSPSRVHQLVAEADRETVEAMLSELQTAGWPDPEDPEEGDDPELAGRDLVADRLSDEVDWLRQCAQWLIQLDTDHYPRAVNLRPAADWPATAHRAVDHARVAAVVERVAADVDELARARRVKELDTAAVRTDARDERRRHAAEPELDFRTFCASTSLPTSSTPQLERAWQAWQDERYRRGERDNPPDFRDNPFHPGKHISTSCSVRAGARSTMCLT